MRAPIERVEARAFRIPTDRPEADGTLNWDCTTLVAVHVTAGGMRGFGHSYGSAAMVPVIDEYAPRLYGVDAMATERAFSILVSAVRNIGRPGIAATAISAVDAALWDLKAKLLGVSLVRLLGAARDTLPAYGSGGFTNERRGGLPKTLSYFLEQGFSQLKMKIGADPAADVERVRAVRAAVGDGVTLMVDANGAYTRKQALDKARAFAASGVVWFEEPVSSDDLAGLRLMRDRAPPGMDVAAGEYGYDPPYFQRMLDAQAVDVLQVDASRCLGVTGFMAALRVAEAHHVPISTHTAPTLHASLGCMSRHVVHAEYFFDHARIESMLFEGFRPAKDGALRPDPDRPGLGVELKLKDAERYAV